MGFEHAVCGQCKLSSRFCIRFDVQVGDRPAICFECIDKVHREHAARFAEVFNEEIKRTKPTAAVRSIPISDDEEHGLGKPTITRQRSLFSGVDTVIASYKIGGFILRGEGAGHFPSKDSRCWSLWYAREKSPRFPVGTRKEALSYLAGLRRMISEKKKHA